MNIAVITGASSGLGKEFAKQIDKIEKLDEIWVIARREDKLEALKQELETPVRVMPLDLEKNESFDAYINILKTVKPNIRYLVNASGFGEMGDYEEVPLDTAMRMVDVNVKALVRMTTLSLSYMEKGSYVIQMGSASVFNPLPYFNIYASTKAFVRHYSIALNEELKPRGIQVTLVCPGWVDTEFFSHTKDDTVKHSPKAYKPMVKADDVVKKALRDAKKGKVLTVYGAFTKAQHVASKILPYSALIKIWKNMLK